MNNGQWNVLSAMITPAVLIMATGSLMLTTSQRLSRSIDRARKLGAAIEPLEKDPAGARKRGFLLRQLMYATRRVRLLQRSMVLLYLAIGFFVATSGALGVIELGKWDWGLVPVILGMGGAVLLLLASGLLIVESRVLLRALNEEMSELTNTCEERELKIAEREAGRS